MSRQLKNIKNKTIITEFKQLEPNCFYCEGDNYLEESIYQSFNERKIEIVHNPHCLKLRLTHIINWENKNGIKVQSLLAQSFHGSDEEDVENNVLIDVKPGFEPEDDATINLDLLNQIFTLKNFLTLSINNERIKLVEDNCHFSKLPFHHVALVISKDYHSIMKFHCSTIFDISANGSFLVSYEPENVDIEFNQNEGNIMEIDNENNDDNDNDMIQNQIHSLQNDDWYSTPVPQSISETQQNKYNRERQFLASFANSSMNLNSISNDQENLSPKAEAILQEIPEDLKQKHNLKRFIKNNIDLTNDEEIQIAKLSNVVYPSNDFQSEKFINVVGIILKSFRQEIHITDGSISKFTINLKEADKNYPEFLSGDIVCIRQVSLKRNRMNMCSHHSQLTVIKLYQQDDIIKTSNGQKISAQELKYIAQLYCTTCICLSNHLFQSYGSKDLVLTNSTGQILYKRETDARTDVYLLLPEPAERPCNFDDNVFKFMIDQIQSMAINSNPDLCKEDVLRKLKTKNQIVLISVYENHQIPLKTMLPLDFATFLLVHLKNDRYFKGYFHYILHGGNQFNQNVKNIPKKSLFGEDLQNKIESILKETLEEIESFNDIENLNPNAQYFLSNLNEALNNDNNNNKNNNDNTNTKNVSRINCNEQYKFTIKKMIKYIKQERILFQSFVNIEIAQKVSNFQELISSSESSLNIENNKLLYRVTGYLFDYKFEDENGFKIFNMAHLRKNLMKFICTNLNCDFIVPFTSYFLPRSYDLFNDENEEEDNDNLPEERIVKNEKKRLLCPNCQSFLTAYLSIDLNLLDENEQHLKVLLTSPECEELVGIPNDKLIFSNPNQRAFCKAFLFALRTLCPNRSFSSDSEEEENKKLNISPKVDWILEAVPKNLESDDDSQRTEIYEFDLDDICMVEDNNQTNNKKSEVTDFLESKFVFYVRNIIIKE